MAVIFILEEEEEAGSGVLASAATGVPGEADPTMNCVSTMRGSRVRRSVSSPLPLERPLPHASVPPGEDVVKGDKDGLLR